MGSLMTAMKEKGAKGRRDGVEEFDLEDVEARPDWEQKASTVEPVQASRHRLLSCFRVSSFPLPNTHQLH